MIRRLLNALLQRDAVPGTWAMSSIPGEWLVYWTGDMRGVATGCRARGMTEFKITRFNQWMYRVVDESKAYQ
jgi:hypothetical protein